MSLHRCLHGCPGYATRQFDGHRERKVAGLAMFVCQTCGAEFSSPHETSVRPTSMYAIVNHKEECWRCGSEVMEFGHISTDTGSACFSCVCGYFVSIPERMWDELHRGIPEVLDLMDAEDQE